MNEDSADTLTLGAFVGAAVEQLRAAGVVDPEISARRVGEAAAGVSAASYLAARDEALTQRMVAYGDALLARRMAGEPLQYVVGSWGFRGLDLAVDRRALIPRPETEVVAGIGVGELLGLGRASVAVDLGTGSGAIALALAQEVPGAAVHGTDRSTDALALARANLAGLGRAGSRVLLHEGDWFEALPSELGGTIDLIISNPPYVAEGDELPDVVRHWEPLSALLAGPDGLSDLRRVVDGASDWLRPGGLLVVECAPDQAAWVREFAGRRGLVDARVHQDLTGRDRAVVARRPLAGPPASEIDEAVRVLAAGGVVVAPTDTIPGLLARYDDEAAVRSVYRVKRRPEAQPLPILVSGWEQAERLVDLGERGRMLAQEHWPGGLTIVAARRGGPDPVHGAATLGVRVPAMGWLRRLIDDVGPVTGSSANLHGEETLDDPRDAGRTLGVTTVVSAPGSPVLGTASTVVEVVGDRVTVLRAGAVELGSAEQSGPTE